MSQESKLPGEKIAFLEEYLSGENTFDDGESVRSTMIGKAEFDKEERIASVKNEKSIPVPKIGDEIVGIVEAALGSLIAVSMQYINGTKVHANVECICTTRHMRKKNVNKCVFESKNSPKKAPFFNKTQVVNNSAT